MGLYLSCKHKSTLSQLFFNFYYNIIFSKMHQNCVRLSFYGGKKKYGLNEKRGNCPQCNSVSDD